jgi:spheroidene monooxygenase
MTGIHSGRNPIQTVSLSLFRFSSLATRVWAFGMMGFARWPLSHIPELQFWKLCGSGPDGSFMLRFNPSVYTVLCVWPDEETARDNLQNHPLFRRYNRMCSEHAQLLMAPVSARGAWSGAAPFESPTNAHCDADGPIAALTRATLRPRIALRFWDRVPDINAVIGSDPNVLFRIGMGEMPALHQITFSIWPDSHSMARFARHSGPHADAIKAVRKEGWFSEELYARFRIVDAHGTWNAQSFSKEFVR